MGIPRKDALLKAKSDVSDPRTNAVIKRSLDKETKTTNRVVEDTIKLYLNDVLIQAIQRNEVLLMGQNAMDRFKKDNMETMKNVIKSIKEEMSKGFRLLSEATQENLKVLQIKVDRIKEKNSGRKLRK